MTEMTDASDEAPDGGGPAPAPPTRRGAADARRSDPSDPVGSFQEHVRAARTEFEGHVAQARAEFEEANERIKARTGRDLILASLIGVVIGAVLVASLVFVKWTFIVFALAAALLGIFEFARALVAAGRKVDVVAQLVAATALILTAFFLDSWLHWVAVFAAVALVVVWRLVGQMAAHDGRPYNEVLADALVAGFLQLYVAFLASLCVVILRQEGGQWWVLAFIIVAVVADTGAYAAGVALGRHQMAPRISPNKTWEGFAGAALAAGIAGVLLGMFMLGLQWWMGLVFGLAILVTATAGDLGESMIKRDLGIKDMSSWIPGHGGVLDRLDSILPSTIAALAMYYFFTPLVA